MQVIPLKESKNSIQIAVQMLRQKELIGFPTDSVYGLCGIFDKEVALRLHQVRKRSYQKPFLIVIPEGYSLDAIIKNDLDPRQKEFIMENWPGRKTIVFFKKKSLFYPGGNTIAIRRPSQKDNPLFYELLHQLGEPILAPSLNLPMQSPMVDVNEIKKNFKDDIKALFTLKGYQPSDVSQIWDLTKKEFRRLR